MLVNVFRTLFILASVLLVFMMAYGKFFVFKKREPQFISDYCALLAGIVGAYSLLALGLALLLTNNVDKLTMVLLAVSPFLLGLVTTYHTEKYFTWVQVGLFMFSAYFVL